MRILHRAFNRALLTAAFLTAACSASEIDTLAYDASKAPPAPAGSESPDSVPIDVCWLSGEEMSVFVGRIVTRSEIELPLDHCPEPQYYTSWVAAEINVTEVAAGKAPGDDDTFHFIGTTRIPLGSLEVGDSLLMTARWWAPTKAWIVTQTVGVEVNPAGSTASTDAGSMRPIDLPTTWSTFVSELKQSRGSDCGRKANEGEYDDALFDEYTLHRGKENYDRECSGYEPPAPQD